MKMFLSFGWPLAIAAMAAASLGLIYWADWNIHPNPQAGELGQLGDFFGGLLNPLVSALTLFVAISVWRLQKEELELTRNELGQTKLAMEDQAKTTEQQRREQRFFDLLNLYRATLDSISIAVQAKETVLSISGRRVFSHIVEGRGQFLTISILQLFGTSGHRLPEWNPSNSGGKTQENWNRLAPLVDHYFRVLFTLLREAQPILGEEHFRYIKMLRAQLSRDELFFIAMNVLFDSEGMKMRGLVEKYGLLKHLTSSHLRSIAEEQLAPRSFGQNWALNHLIQPKTSPYVA